MRQFQIKKELLKIDASFNIPYDLFAFFVAFCLKKNDFRWTVNPFEVNAFYSVLQNMIGKCNKNRMIEIFC